MGRLLDQVRREVQEEQQGQVDELLDPYLDDQHMRPAGTGMDKLAGMVHAQQRDRNISRATSYARENSGLAANELVYQVATTYGLTVEDANRVVRAVRNE